MFKKLNILKLFFEEPNREFNVRETARILKIAPATASKKLKDLSKRSILKHRKERVFDLYKANIESYAYKDLKVYYTIRKLRDSNLIESLNEFYLKPTMILYGSCSKGTDTETSDIDMIVISENTKEFPKKGEYEKKIGKNIHIFTVGKLSDLKNKHLINNVLNGILLEGELAWN